MLGHATYLVLEVAWALPVLALQWLVGRRRLRQRWRTLLLAVAVATLYLACADAVAIANGIWALHANRIVGLRVGDVPIEEIIFFLLTNAMVVQSVLLIMGGRNAMGEGMRA
jgi:lycopene cyclase domain-containing protein